MEDARPVRQGRSAGRTTAVVALLLAALLPLGFVLAVGWRSVSGDLDRVRAQQQGVTLVVPLVRLTAALTAAQVAAAGGGPVDQGVVRSAVADVDAAGGPAAAGLGVTDRWNDLRRQIAGAGDGSAADGAVRFGDLAAQAAGLLGTVGAASTLTDGRDAAERAVGRILTVHVPALLTAGGRAAALAALAPAGRAGDPVRAAAADRVGRAVLDLGQEVRAAPARAGGTDSTAPALVEGMLLAATDVAPTAPGLGPPARYPSAATAAAGQREIEQLSVRLGEVAAPALGAELRDRESARSLLRLGLVVAGLAALVLLLAVLWVRLPAPDPDGPADEALGPVERGADTEPAPSAAELIDARALLRETEVVRVGRAVQSVPRRSADDDADH